MGRTPGELSTMSSRVPVCVSVCVCMCVYKRDSAVVLIPQLDPPRLQYCITIQTESLFILSLWKNTSL
jgi:hypothetical protein